MSPIDLAAIGFIVIAAIVGACGWGFRWLKRLAGLVVGAIVGCLLLGTAGLVCRAWSPPGSSVDAVFRESPVLRTITNETVNAASALGIDMDGSRYDNDLGTKQ